MINIETLQESLSKKLAEQVPPELGSCTVKEYLDSHPGAWKLIQHVGEVAATTADTERVSHLREKWRTLAMVHGIRKLLVVHADNAAIERARPYWLSVRNNPNETL